MKQEMVNHVRVEIIKDPAEDLLASKINSSGREDKDDAFFVADLSDILHKHKLWKALLSRVEPFYAVKCNDDPAVLGLLAQLGTGFDCASKAEIHKILHLSVAAGRIVYANPCKQTSHIRYAAKHHVSLITFDNEIELHKMKAVYPDARLLLRILLDDSQSQCQLGMKYGCPPQDCGRLLRVARHLSLNVIGVSFHVGSGCYDAGAYVTAVAAARAIFDVGAGLGFRFEMLDIGGGFPGQKSSPVSFSEICAVLRPALDRHFPASSGVRLIAEPGRFFVASAFTLAVNVIAKRKVVIPDNLPSNTPGDKRAAGDTVFMYYVNDGVYGSFNCLLYDHAEVEPSVIEGCGEPGAPLLPCSVWGPTCDGLDCVRARCMLPEMHVGDWLSFRDMGAYTLCASSNFNGMPRPRCYYVMHEMSWAILAKASCGREAASVQHTLSTFKLTSLDLCDPDYIGLPDSVCA